ncbi:hypothetical protein SLS60_009717 [Paraconiothyrium brasiliense]|uniref:Cytochrome P450 n=1 Tax=Paraconiothyrium brasiliense TaxID=300254 RepID=A0ABR3QTC5_9PLEO
MNIIYTSDKVAVAEVLAKRKVFIKPKLYEMLNMFGKNVDTVNGEEWSRHRKITAPCFNERVSSFVWDESVRQSQAMFSQWLAQPGGKVSRMVDDARIVALHVLYAAGFGVQHDFSGGARVSAPGYKLSHRDTLMTMLNNFIATMIVAPQEAIFDKIVMILSPRMKSVLLAIQEFRRYTDEAIASERKLLAEDRGDQRHNLMSTLIRTSDQAKADGAQSALSLTDDEIKGNIFIFNVAGHDTTANTLAYAFALLAINADIQKWVTDEIDEVLEGDESSVYEDAYPRLKRVMAVMYETLRLFGPVPQIPRRPVTPNVPLTITRPNAWTSMEFSSSTTTLLIPANTLVNLNIHAMHTTPSTYTSPKVWNPKRWITSTSPTGQSASSDRSTLQNEKLLHMEQGFAPWASGPRICPGMKFAQVEFTAVLSTVLKRARIAPSVKGGEDGSGMTAKTEVEALLQDSHHIGATVSMKRPEDLWLKVVER